MAAPPGVDIRLVEPADEARLPNVLLDAYRGTTDDEGEGEQEARDALAWSFAVLVPAWSHVAVEGDRLVGMAFVWVVADLPYVDPVAVRADAKGRGIGRALVSTCLQRVEGDEIGAVITDGNTPSERLFAGLGFRRVGTWPP